jgi:two-component system cell cycle sensor histidine kinase/response regulator CckA
MLDMGLSKLSPLSGSFEVSTILLVEDEPSILTLMAGILEVSGHIVLKATACEEAFQQFEEADASIDLLIADVNLPGTSGIRIALGLRSSLPNLGIILTSGHTPDMWDQDDLAELDEVPSESVAILQKPFLPATLLQTISRFVSVPFRPEVALAKAS